MATNESDPSGLVMPPADAQESPEEVIEGAAEHNDAQPRWLTADERAAWLAAVALMTELPPVLDAQMQRDAGLTFFEYMVLALLSEQPDRTLSMSELAQAASASLSRLSHVAARLEKQGLLRRIRRPGAGRRTNATLTHAGYAKVVKTAPGHVAAVRNLFIDALTSPELAALESIGSKVTSRGGSPHKEI
ncbi:MarR family winged helix-turn-helix transcriptional regulator [Microbispora catharanthi]|nr:MarR family transcriptional regulator [Microbispora catharanthi]